ncbi:hypothetical protein GUITHDRAFT_73898, partial [Guillardia theta CCMP2712]
LQAQKRIGTHDGAFHCDEVLACWMLHQTKQFADAEIVRTREENKLSEMDIVVDVGAVFDPSTHRYDHHQKSFTDTFDEKHVVTKLSSAGLIYKYFGQEILQNIVKSVDVNYEKLYHLVYDNFIEEIDAVDNGVQCYAADAVPKYKVSTMLGQRVARLNPSWNDQSKKPDEQFQKAMQIVGDEMESIVNYYAKAFLPARSIVYEAISSRLDDHPSGKIIVLKTACPWKDHLFEIEKELQVSMYTLANVLYAVYEDQGGSWRVQAVPERPESFHCRKALPEAWRGIRDQALSDLTGVQGCIFVHATGFIGGAQTR